MNNSFVTGILGRTGLKVGRLGVSGGYGAPAKAFEMAFERGCNYFYHGSLRREGMNTAIKNLCTKGMRDKIMVVAQCYWRSEWLFRRSIEKFLSKTNLDYVDVILLGWYNSHPSKKILDTCAEMKEKGFTRFIAISGHNRKAFPAFAAAGIYDIFHVRYNAAHRGAETEVFNKLDAANRPGIVTYTATRWGGLINPKKMPKGERTPRASDCYRFVLSNPFVDVCIAGPKNMEQMNEALASLDRGALSEEEMAWMRRIGSHLRA
jgi:aryl-alcohol dehydrogenase-like predicted oxidoreductase